MIGRRGFLGALLASAAVAADPDILLWRPGKLISIPPRLHVPRLHQFFVDSEILLNVQDRGVPGLVADLEARYLGPAAAAIDAHIRRCLAEVGTARSVRFGKMSIPQGVASAWQGPLGKLPNARVISQYDIVEDRCHVRVDCQVTI